MDFQLNIIRGRGASETVKLADGVTTVGRQDDCGLRIKSSQVSRKHCEIFEKKGLLLVKDLGSSNGTFVNGERIDGQRVIEPGDTLTIGPVKLKVSKIGEAPPARSPKPAIKPGDTAVVEVLTAEVTEEEDFEIEFDDNPQPVPAAAPAAAAAAPSAAAAPPPKQPEPAPEPQPQAESENNLMGDDAIADFLLDLKIDDDK
jgi:pSer/pThr/pTyr-binding forkhead associated (FHA) protein